MRISYHYGLDPEFFDKHLSFVGDDDSTCNIHPPYHVLPSQQQFIFQTSLTSIAGVLGDSRHNIIAAKRDDFAVQMNTYLHTLRLGKDWGPFDSIVRAVEVHDLHRFSIEQSVTVLIKRYDGCPEKWISETLI